MKKQTINWKHLFTNKQLKKMLGIRSSDISLLIKNDKLYRKKVNGIWLYSISEKMYNDLLEIQIEFGLERLKYIIIMTAKGFYSYYKK